MKKIGMMLILCCLLAIGIGAFKVGSSSGVLQATYINGELVSNIPKKGEVVFSKAVCDNNATDYYWDTDNWGLFISNLSKKTKCNLYFVKYDAQTIFNFDYTGSEQTFVAPVSGTYRLETWGAQGGSYNNYTGGYGAYSIGNVSLNANSKIYLNVGGVGLTNLGLNTISAGGYNGGGTGKSSNNNKNSFGSGGGGATHVALKSGLLSSFANNKSSLFIVSGGGGGVYVDLAAYPNYSLLTSGHAGGYIGNQGTSQYTRVDAVFAATGGTQIDGNSFGQGASCKGGNCEQPGGGGGYYGGKNNSYCAGGGSSYIGNPLLKNKAMYCYNCEESNEESIKTISTTCSEETPVQNCAKKGNGYARITLVSIDE